MPAEPFTPALASLSLAREKPTLMRNGVGLCKAGWPVAAAGSSRDKGSADRAGEAGEVLQDSRPRRNITVVEVKEDKVMLKRNNDFITLGGKFPRLTKKDAKARLKELKLLLAL